MPRAASLADAIKKEFNVETKLIEGSGGAFEVRVDGTLLWSRLQTGCFPEPRELLDKIKAAGGS